uniref:Uncharacterized protein n=2 Tax=Entomoneis paludosa TaxID=265537 RepID=A0A7S2YJH5_9STRA|mmetsp:Transcript_3532/g.7353  ORF Transcript_3532/g.7353 Transcript_3532/m.7353 type:complete len:171 (+) Transcript_3532:532-1044(+)
MPNNASLSNNANHQMFFAAAAAGGLEFSPQVPASSNELNPYVPHKGVAASSALNVGTSSSISMDGVVGNFQYLHVAGDEFEPLGPADAHQEADEFAPFSPIAVTQPYVTVPAAKAKKSGLSLSATQALQIPTAEELIAAGGLGGIKDTMSEFSNLSLTESDRLDLGNMSD